MSRGGRSRRLFLPVGLFATLLLFLSVVACGGGTRDDPPPDPHQELRDRLGLDPDREIDRVTLGGRGGDEHVAPTLLRVGPGAVVEFVCVDGRVHSVRFPRDSLTAEAAAFLSRTSQLASPPLVDRGSRFVLTFEGAPPGRYPFLVEGSGGAGRGVIVVGAEG